MIIELQGNTGGGGEDRGLLLTRLPVLTSKK